MSYSQLAIVTNNRRQQIVTYSISVLLFNLQKLLMSNSLTWILFEAIVGRNQYKYPRQTHQALRHCCLVAVAVAAASPLPLPCHCRCLIAVTPAAPLPLCRHRCHRLVAVATPLPRCHRHCSAAASLPYPQNIELPIKIIAINCQLKLIAGLEKRQLIKASPTII